MVFFIKSFKENPRLVVVNICASTNDIVRYSVFIRRFPKIQEVPIIFQCLSTKLAASMLKENQFKILSVTKFSLFQELVAAVPSRRNWAGIAISLFVSYHF